MINITASYTVASHGEASWGTIAIAVVGFALLFLILISGGKKTSDVTGGLLKNWKTILVFGIPSVGALYLSVNGNLSGGGLVFIWVVGVVAVAWLIGWAK